MWEIEEKLLGVIGGMGPEATKLFYEMIINNTDAQCDQDHLNMIIFNHASMPDRTKAILSGNLQSVKNYLVTDAQRLEKDGCAAIAIPCNTSHYFTKDIQSAISIPLINMPEITAKAAKKAGAKKLGILATDGTIKSKIYQSALDNEGLKYEIPSENMQKAVMGIIYDDIKAGKGLDSTHMAPVIDELKKAGCDMFILGCTELSIYGKHFKLPKSEYIDAMDELAIECIKFCGKKIKSK